VYSVAFSPDEKYIATAGASGGSTQLVYLRNVSDDRIVWLITPTLACVYAVSFSPDGQTLAFGGFTVDGSGSVGLWNLKSTEDASEDAFTNLDVHLSRSVLDLVFSQTGHFWPPLWVTDLSSSGMLLQIAAFIF
jgi:WD40 repeat protein